MRKLVDNFSKFYTLEDIISYSRPIQKKILTSLSDENRNALINECLKAYHSALNDNDDFSFNRINKYANIYTLLLCYKDAA